MIKSKNGETVTVDGGKISKLPKQVKLSALLRKMTPKFTTVTTTDAAGNKTVLNGTGMTITPTGGANPGSTNQLV